MHINMKKAKKLQKQFISAMQIFEDEIKISFPDMFVFLFKGRGQIVQQITKTSNTKETTQTSMT